MAMFQPAPKRRRIWEDKCLNPTVASTSWESTSTLLCATSGFDQVIQGNAISSELSYNNYSPRTSESNEEVYDQPMDETQGPEEDVCFGMVSYTI
jgi:hypothetical protein